MASIEPGLEVFRKALYWKVKIPSAIAAACPNRFVVTILWADLVFIGT